MGAGLCGASKSQNAGLLQCFIFQLFYKFFENDIFIVYSIIKKRF